MNAFVMNTVKSIVSGLGLLSFGMACGVAPLQAAFVIEIDIDGADDGLITYNPLFSFENDTTTASQSAASGALGLTGGDSIFGGNGVNSPDSYRYEYTPDANPDNLMLTAGTDLGEGNLATGLVGGTPGIYRVYATWPFTSNVSGGLTRYTVTTDGDQFTVDINQNDVDPGEAGGRGDEWVLLGEISYTSRSIVVLQQPTGGNTFVSQRAAGVLFERVPEPSCLVLLGVAIVGFAPRRARRI